MRRAACLRLAVLLAVLACVGVSEAAVAAPQGQVQFYSENSPSTDQYWIGATQQERDWLVAHYKRTRSYTPFFDQFTSWFPNAWVYKDAYAVYKPGAGEPEAGAVPETYMLHSSATPSAANRLYIPFNCGSGCPQYAADITNPAWRSYWISQAQTWVNRGSGYKGIFVDDVNLESKVSDSTGNENVSIYNFQGQLVTESMWQDAMADFMEEIRAAFPAKELVHNQVWFFAGGETNPEVRRAIAAADVIEVERGHNDPGIDTLGEYDALARWIEYVHSVGKKAVLDNQHSGRKEWALANYLLTNAGEDFFGHPDQAVPDNWWSPGWDADLGAASAGRSDWFNTVMRPFASGVAAARKPGAGGSAGFVINESKVHGAVRSADGSISMFGGLPLGSASTSPDLSSPGAGRLDLFARATDGTLRHRYWQRSGLWYRDWSAEENHGGFVQHFTKPDSTWRDSQRLDVIVTGQNGTVYQKYWTPSGWSAFVSLGGTLAGSPAATWWRRPDNTPQLNLIGRGSDNRLTQRYWNNGWSYWGAFGGPVVTGDPEIVSWGNNRLDVFANGADGLLYHRWYTGAWSAWETLGPAQASGVTAAVPAANRLVLFARSAQNKLVERTFDSAGWSGWTEASDRTIDVRPAAVSTRPAGAQRFATLDGNLADSMYLAPGEGAVAKGKP